MTNRIDYTVFYKADPKDLIRNFIADGAEDAVEVGGSTSTRRAAEGQLEPEPAIRAFSQRDMEVMGQDIVQRFNQLSDAIINGNATPYERMELIEMVAVGACMECLRIDIDVYHLLDLLPSNQEVLNELHRGETALQQFSQIGTVLCLSIWISDRLNGDLDGVRHAILRCTANLANLRAIFFNCELNGQCRRSYFFAKAFFCAIIEDNELAQEAIDELSKEEEFPFYTTLLSQLNADI